MTLYLGWDIVRLPCIHLQCLFKDISTDIGLLLKIKDHDEDEVPKNVLQNGLDNVDEG